MKDNREDYSQRPKTIFRVKKSGENPYVMLDKRPIYRDDLSWKAKGIWTYLMCKPDNWQANIQDIVNHGPEGREAVRTAFQELRRKGYMKKYQMRNESGQFGQYIWLVFEEAQTPDTEDEDNSPPVYIEPLPDTRTAVQPKSDYPTSVNPVSGKSDTNNKEVKRIKEFKIKDVKAPWENNGHHKDYNPKKLKLHDEDVQAFLSFKEHMKAETHLATYLQWIEPIWLEDIVNDVFILGAPTPTHEKWAIERVLQTALNYFKGINLENGPPRGIEIRHIKEQA